jgi:hypothetical protein
MTSLFAEPSGRYLGGCFAAKTTCYRGGAQAAE